jgi:hypothetical protein
MKSLLILCMCTLAVNIQAETLELEYSSFFSHIKKLSAEDKQALQFAFGFKQVGSASLCHLQNVYIHTQKMDIPVVVSEQQRFVLPDEKALKMAQALVMVDLQEAANHCDLSVQLETKPAYLKTNYSYQELNILLTQYQTFFTDMGGFLSFLMPSVQGLVLDFGPQQNVFSILGLGTLEKGKLTLTNDWLSQKTGLELPIKPLRITALTNEK